MWATGTPRQSVGSLGLAWHQRCQVEAEQDSGTALKSPPTPISGSAALIISCHMALYTNFLTWMQMNTNSTYLHGQKCYLPMTSDDADIRLSNVARIYSDHLFTSQFHVYLQFTKSGRLIPQVEVENIVTNSCANFWEKLSKALTARPQKNMAKLDPQWNFSRLRLDDCASGC